MVLRVSMTNRWAAVALLRGLLLPVVGGLATAPGLQGQQSPQPVTRLSANVNVVGEVRSGAVVQLSFQVTADKASPAVEARLHLPEGLEVLSGDTVWRGSLGQGQQTILRVHARIQRAGIYRVGGWAQDTTPKTESTALSPDATANAYLAAGERRGFIDGDLNERFVPPGRRALPALLNLREEQTRPGATEEVTVGVSRFGTASGRPAGEALSRALARLDAAGVEALFADSAGQIGELRTAIATDRAAPRENVSPPWTPLQGSTLNAMSCPAGYVSRSGYVDFLNGGSGLRERLPNVLVYASSAPHGFAGNTVTFRAGGDGSFDQCFPYNASGYTHITVYQDIGPVRIFRDGASPPSTFPQWYDATWDLNQSPTIPIDTRHPEVSFALRTFYDALSTASSVFTAQRTQVDAWYYTNTAIDYYCSSGGIGQCSRLGENIYLHRYAPTSSGAAYDNIYTEYGRFGKAHEYGHAWDHAIMGGIGGSCSGGHSLYIPNNVGCAVKEGWADLFAAMTLPLVYTNAELNTGAGPRGPETEGAVMAYMFDLVDNANLPYLRRVPTADDDEVSVSTDYLVQVLRDGRTNYSSPIGRVVAVQEIIAIIDDVTPIPYKSEFASYVQPTGLATRVPQSPAISVLLNRRLWLRDLFDRTESPTPLVVDASVPGWVGVKGTYSLLGSASGGAGGYHGWLWEWADDCTYCSYGWWSDYQNTQFVAYAGSYTINWRLTARDAASASDVTHAQTVVCTGGGPECLAFAVANREPGAAPVSGMAPREPGGSVVSRASSPTARGDHHFGSGPWFSRDQSAAAGAAQLYSLTGRHYGWSSDHSWPNSLAARGGAVARQSLEVDGETVILSQRTDKTEPGVSLVEVSASQLRTGRPYRISFAVDPDLGLVPSDDRLSWIDSLEVVVVSDPDSGAVAYSWASGERLARPTVREYTSAPGLREPGNDEAAYLEQRAATRILGEPGDVRFALNLGPALADQRGEVSATLVVARGHTMEEVLARVVAARQRYPGAMSASRAAANSSGVRSFALRQSLSRAPNLSRAGESSSAAMTAANLRSSGITALTYAVPDGQVTEVRIRIFNNTGQLVRSLVQEQRGSGEYLVEWDRRNDRGEMVAPGVYTAVMEAGAFRATRKLVVTH